MSIPPRAEPSAFLGDIWHPWDGHNVHVFYVFREECPSACFAAAVRDVADRKKKRRVHTSSRFSRLSSNGFVVFASIFRRTCEMAGAES